MVRKKRTTNGTNRQPITGIPGESEEDFNPLNPKRDLNQISHCNIKGLSVREIMRIENMINSS